MATSVCNFLGTGGLWGIAWDGWAALATAFAAIVALVVPFSLTRREWRRQKRLRKKENRRREKQRRDSIREVCSAVDQILAYTFVFWKLSRAKPSYYDDEGEAVAARISDNVQTLIDVLRLIRQRPEISDGAIFSAVAVERIAEKLLTTAATPKGTARDWRACADMIEQQFSSVVVVRSRVRRVRRYLGLPRSESAAQIVTKYNLITSLLKRGKAPNGTKAADAISVVPMLLETHW